MENETQHLEWSWWGIVMSELCLFTFHGSVVYKIFWEHLFGELLWQLCDVDTIQSYWPGWELKLGKMRGLSKRTHTAWLLNKCGPLVQSIVSFYSMMISSSGWIHQHWIENILNRKWIFNFNIKEVVFLFAFFPSCPTRLPSPGGEFSQHVISDTYDRHEV